MATRATGLSRVVRAMLAVLALMAIFAGAARADVSIERVAYKGWTDAYRLSNGTVELVVVPSVARIVRYGFVGGANVLWENPVAAGKPIPLGEWPNTGGDKVWPWPQGEWPARTGRAWPPPAGTDQAPQQARIVAPGTLRLVSPLVVPYGVRLVRDIRLAPSGTQVRITSRFEKMREGAAAPVAVWSVTQVPISDTVIVRRVPGSSLTDGYKMYSTSPFQSIRVENNLLFVARPRTVSTKLGADADRLAIVLDDLLFTETLQNGGDEAAGWQPGDRAQVYSQPEVAADQAQGIMPYIELEMTSPLRSLARGESVSLEVVWELHKLTPEQRNPAKLSEIVRTR